MAAVTAMQTDGTILQFLDGSHSYEGVWFGDKHPTKNGSFCWRPVLHEYFKQQIIDAFDESKKDMMRGSKDNPVQHGDGQQYYNNHYKQ